MYWNSITCYNVLEQFRLIYQTYRVKIIKQIHWLLNRILTVIIGFKSSTFKPHSLKVIFFFLLYSYLIIKENE